MMVTGKTITAVMPQISIAPQPPMSRTELPSEPSRKPGFARQMTNPSYHRSVFRSCRSSTIASATFPPPGRQYGLSYGNRGRAADGNTCPGDFQRELGRARRTIVRVAQATDHDQMRVRREQGGRLRRSLALRGV